MVRLIWFVLATLAHAVECGIVTENTQVHPLDGQGAGVGAVDLGFKVFVTDSTYRHSHYMWVSRQFSVFDFMEQIHQRTGIEPKDQVLTAPGGKPLALSMRARDGEPLARRLTLGDLNVSRDSTFFVHQRATFGDTRGLGGALRR